MDKPTVEPAEGPPPADLVVEDLAVGDGPEARARGTAATTPSHGLWQAGGPVPPVPRWPS